MRGRTKAQTAQRPRGLRREGVESFCILSLWWARQSLATNHRWPLCQQGGSPCCAFLPGEVKSATPLSAAILSRRVRRRRLVAGPSEKDCWQTEQTWLLAPRFQAVLRSPITPLGESRMPSVLLLVSPSCGACPSAKSLWKQLRVKYSFSYREVDITTPDGQELANRHSVRATPATIIDGRLTFVGVPGRESAEKALQLKMRPREG